MSDLNKDAPIATTLLGLSSSTLTDLVRASYPADANNVCLHTIRVPENKSYDKFEALHLWPGFKEICETNMYIELVSVVVRFCPVKTGVNFLAGLTVNASSSSKAIDIHAMKTMVSRRVTDLSLGAETHMLPFHTGMTPLIRPMPLAGLYPYLAINISGECTVTLEVTYKRGAGAINTTEFNVT